MVPLSMLKGQLQSHEAESEGITAEDTDEGFLADLYKIEWQALTCAYGPADVVAISLRRIWIGDEERQAKAMLVIYDALLRHNNDFTATPPTLTFLLRMFDELEEQCHERIIRAISRLTFANLSWAYSDLTVDLRRMDARGWLNTDLSGERWHYLTGPNIIFSRDHVSEAENERENRIRNLGVSIYTTIRDALPIFQVLVIGSPWVEVRSEAAFLLGFFPECAFTGPFTLSSLYMALNGEQRDIVRWSIIIAIGMLQRSVRYNELSRTWFGIHRPILEKFTTSQEKSTVVAADLALTRIGCAKQETLERMGRYIMNEPIPTPLGFPWESQILRGNVIEQVYIAIGHLDGEQHPELVNLMLNKVAQLNETADANTSPILVACVVDMVFIRRNNMEPLPPFNDLKDTQKMLMRCFANISDSVLKLKCFRKVLSVLPTMPQTAEEFVDYIVSDTLMTT